MKLIEIEGNKRRTFLNLENLVKIDLLDNLQIQVTFVGGYFDVISKGSKGYEELRELISITYK